MKNAPLLHAAEYGFFQLLRGLVRALPHRGARAVGRALGPIAFRALGRRRRLALTNLERALPELTATQRRDTARQAFRQMTSQAAELLSWDRFDAVSLCRRWTLDGWEHLTAATASSRAAFLMTAHFGHWEILGPAVSLYAPPALALVRPLDNPRLETVLAGIRGRFGLELVRKHGAARRLVGALEEGGRILVLLDQRVPRRDAIEVSFFGRPVQASSLVARLALRHQTPVVPIFAYPAPHGRYRIVVRRPIPPAGSAADPVVDLTQRYQEAVEREIRREPGLWLWMHDRWRLT